MKVCVSRIERCVSRIKKCVSRILKCVSRILRCVSRIQKSDFELKKVCEQNGFELFLCEQNYRLNSVIILNIQNLPC